MSDGIISRQEEEQLHTKIALTDLVLQQLQVAVESCLLNRQTMKRHIEAAIARWMLQDWLY